MPSGGSLVTLGKAESEKYLKDLEDFNAKNDNNEEDGTADTIAPLSQWIAVINNENEIKLILKK